MAKKDKQAKKDKSGGTASDAVDAIRSAIERGLEGAGLTDKRQREVVEQVTAAAGRIRKTLDDLKVVDEVHEMRAQLETLAARVAELESSARTRVTGAARAASSRATNSGTTTTTTRARSSTAAKPRSTSTRSSTAAKSSGAAKPRGAAKSSSAAKPRAASTRSSTAKPKPPTTRRTKPSS
jgi:hypothetical protein